MDPNDQNQPGQPDSSGTGQPSGDTGQPTADQMPSEPPTAGIGGVQEEELPPPPPVDQPDQPATGGTPNDSTGSPSGESQ